MYNVDNEYRCPSGRSDILRMLGLVFENRYEVQSLEL
jgi:hypothetical protein